MSIFMYLRDETYVPWTLEHWRTVLAIKTALDSVRDKLNTLLLGEGAAARIDAVKPSAGMLEAMPAPTVPSKKKGRS